jgi:sec-independent protein translocase protein TatB
MDFMGIGTWELMVIGLIALIVLGPKQMIVMARKAGELLRQFQDIWQEASKTIDKEIKAIEAEAGDLTSLPREITALTNEVKNALTLDQPSNGKSQAAPAPPLEPSIRPPGPSAWSPAPAAPAAAAVDGSPAPSEPTHPQPAEPPPASSDQPAETPALQPPAGPADPPTRYPAWTTKRR